MASSRRPVTQVSESDLRDACSTAWMLGYEGRVLSKRELVGICLHMDANLVVPWQVREVMLAYRDGK